MFISEHAKIFPAYNIMELSVNSVEITEKRLSLTHQTHVIPAQCPKHFI